MGHAATGNAPWALIAVSALAALVLLGAASRTSTGPSAPSPTSSDDVAIQTDELGKRYTLGVSASAT